MDGDVGIIGAGPAGSVAAQALAQAGARVLLFDGSHPREKPCGGGVTARALAEIAGAGDADRPVQQIVAAGPATTVRRLVLQGDDDAERCVRIELTDNDCAFKVFSRERFDGWLLGRARASGARLVTQRVLGVTLDAHGVTIRTSAHRSRVSFLIGADGTTSLVRRSVARPFTRTQLSIATGFFARGVSSTDVVIRFTTRPPGYFWSFPRPDHLALGGCAQADRSRVEPLRREVARWVDRHALARAARLETYGWPIPSLTSADLQRERPAGDRWMLVGDAAGLVDPLTREGIFFALRSGRHAADALLAGESLANRYEAQLRADIYPELARAARLSRGFFHRGFVRLFLDALESSPPIRRVLVDLVAGRQPYRTLVRRLLETLEVGIAWRFTRHRWSLR